MSLTTFLDNKDVRAKFSQEIKKPRLSLKKQILAPPLTKHYGLVGTAFDYLVRFYIQHLNPKAMTHAWVAEEAQDSLRELRLAYSKDSVAVVKDNVLKKGEQIVSEAKNAYSAYLKSGEMNRDTIKSALLLAQLDTYYRAFIIDEDFGMVDEGDIADLQRLLSILNPSFFKSERLCMLNPTFGTASELVGGADADLVLDNTLIDIKTTSSLDVKRDDFNQLFGYYVLFKIGGIDGAPFEPRIDTLGIYSSRYSELLTFPIKNVIDESKIPAFIQWFKNKADELSTAERRKK